MSIRNSVLGAAAMVLMAASATAAIAATGATAVTELNIRSGPGPQFEVIGLVSSNEQVMVTGCIQGSKWCTLDNGGWVYSDYLTADLSGSPVVLTERYADVGVPAVTYEPKGGAAAGGLVTGAVAGAIIGGPVGAAVGAVAGATVAGTAAAVIDPPQPVRTYITANPGDPIYLDGEVVVGAGLPETVQLREIPDYQYRYVYINGQPVLVEPSTRRIVYVVR
jgi:uncharacterized protein YraI